MYRTVFDRKGASAFLCRLIVGGTWIYAGAVKVLDPDRFLAQVSRFEVGNASMNGFLAHTLPWLEFILGACTLCGIALLESFAVGAVLLTVYMFVQGFAWHRGLGVDCGCGLGAEHDIVGVKTMGRTAIILALNCVAFWLVLTKTRTATVREPQASTGKLISI